MPKGGKGKRTYKGKRSSELLEWRLKFESSDDRYATLADFQAAVDDTRTYFMRTGEELANGVHVIGVWQNPDRRIPGPLRTSDDTGQTLRGFFTSIIQHTGAGGDSGRVYKNAPVLSRETAEREARNRMRDWVHDYESTRQQLKRGESSMSMRSNAFGKELEERQDARARGVHSAGVKEGTPLESFDEAPSTLAKAIRSQKGALYGRILEAFVISVQDEYAEYMSEQDQGDYDDLEDYADEVPF